MSGPEPARLVLQRVGAHVLGRRRHAVTGRFGLRVAPGGIAAPAFGPEPEVLRTSGATLVREVGADTATMAIDGSSLRDLAGFAGADLDPAWTCGTDTPAMGDLDAPLALDAAGAASVAEWLAFGLAVIDEVVAVAGAAATPATPQLWPEHFDLATHVGVPGGAGAAGAPEVRANLGASPGDAGIDEPYLYLGPWGPDRPGDPSYWDAPFGAALRASSLSGDRDADVAAAVAWARRGLGLLGG